MGILQLCGWLLFPYCISLHTGSNCRVNLSSPLQESGRNKLQLDYTLLYSGLGYFPPNLVLRYVVGFCFHSVYTYRTHYILISFMAPYKKWYCTKSCDPRPLKREIKGRTTHWVHVAVCTKPTCDSFLLLNESLRPVGIWIKHLLDTCTWNPSVQLHAMVSVASVTSTVVESADHTLSNCTGSRT